jgi:hypothetical protein
MNPGAFKKKREELSVVGCEEAANVLRRSQSNDVQAEKKIP